MALSLSFEKYADYIGVLVVDPSVGDTGTYSIRKSFTDDVDYSDLLFSQVRNIGQPINWGITDRSLVQGHTYFYWVYFDYGGGGEVLLDSGSARLTQHKLFGRGGGLKGAKRNKTFDYDVECPLCGKNCRRNLLRRGYVKPHTTGTNYLPNGFGPENWVYDDGDPDYFDANVWNWWVNAETDPEFSSPAIEKDSDWRVPPGQNRWPGCPLFIDPSDVTVQFGALPASIPGTYNTHGVWFYRVSGAVDVYLGFSYADGTSWERGYLRLGLNGWMYVERTHGTAMTIGRIPFIKLDGTGTIVIGGSMAHNLWQESDRDGPGSTADGTYNALAHVPTFNPLPNRLSSAGVYTTGGMMDLCPECYSGLRKRVPWE